MKFQKILVLFALVFLSNVLQAKTAFLDIKVSNVYKTQETCQYDLEVTGVDTSEIKAVIVGEKQRDVINTQPQFLTLEQPKCSNKPYQVSVILTNGVTINRPVFFEDSNHQPRLAGYVYKLVVKGALKSLAYSLDSYASKAAFKSFGITEAKRVAISGSLKNILLKLETWEYVTKNILIDQIVGGLMGAGVTRPVATNVAYAVETLLSWVI